MGARAGRLEFGKEVSVSFLPLSHTAALIVDVFMSITFGVCVNFARPDAFKVRFQVLESTVYVYRSAFTVPLLHSNTPEQRPGAKWLRLS